MAATTYYTGQADRISVTHKDANGTAIPHASIVDVRYILRHENGDSLKKFRKTAPADWTALTTETDAGKYTLEIEEKDSKNWKKGKVYLEWFIKIDNADFADDYKPMGVYHLLNIEETNYAGE
jgi:hypothetical protein